MGGGQGAGPPPQSQPPQPVACNVSSNSFQWIKGAGDIGSAVAHRMRGAGLRPVLREGPSPVAARRKMAFAPAVFEGEAELEGMRGIRCGSLPAALECLEQFGCIPVLVGAADEFIAPETPLVMVDARMRKKLQPPAQLEEAPLVIGIGPGFVAGRQVHAAVESNWGETLGSVIWEGAALDYTGQHRVVEGHGEERYVYAPRAGRFTTEADILEVVEAGQVVGRVDGAPLAAPIGGILKGLAHHGIPVVAGAKLVEVEPRAEARYCIGIAERQGKIAEGVLQAIRERMPPLF